MNPVRFAANAAGAAAGIFVGDTIVAPWLAGQFPRFFARTGEEWGADDFVVGACAVAGALLANMAYSKFAK